MVGRIKLQCSSHSYLLVDGVASKSLRLQDDFLPVGCTKVRVIIFTKMKYNIFYLHIEKYKITTNLINSVCKCLTKIFIHYFKSAIWLWFRAEYELTCNQ